MIKPRYNGRVSQPVHYFTRFGTKNLIQATAATTATYGTIHFQLDEVPGYAEYSVMYDWFKINAVKVMLIPLSNVTLTPIYTGAGVNYAYNQQTDHANRCITVIDYNDRTTPTALDDLRQYSNCKVSPNNVIVKRFFHPKPLNAMDEDSIHSNSYGMSQVGSPWIAMQSNQCEYYGIKYGIEHPSMTNNESLYRIEVKYYLAFKGRK